MLSFPILAYNIRNFNDEKKPSQSNNSATLKIYQFSSSISYEISRKTACMVREWTGQMLNVSPLNLIFVDPCIVVQFIKKNPTRCNSASKCYYSIFIWSSTCFGRHTTHHQEPKTALTASGFACVKGCWTCSCWRLSEYNIRVQKVVAVVTLSMCLTKSTNYTSNNLPRIKNQRLPMQF